MTHSCPVQLGSKGLISTEWCFDSHRGVLAALPVDLRQTDASRPELLLYSNGPLEIYYAPVDAVNETARILIVGIMPGRQQAALALQEASRAMAEGIEDQETVLLRAKNTAAFAGVMRRNLISMLAGIGVAGKLGLESTSELWSTSADLLDSNPAVLYPVFVEGQNYGGAAPALGDEPILSAFVSQVLAAALELTPRALVVPLGKAVEGALASLIQSGSLDGSRCLHGFPHPSGSNGHRVGAFGRNREVLADTVKQWFSAAPPRA